MFKPNNTCHRCGIKCGWFDLTELREIYRCGGMIEICNKCGSKSDSFINYYGKKKQKDKDDLFEFLLSGKLVQDRFYQINNAGYNRA